MSIRCSCNIKVPSTTANTFLLQRGNLTAAERGVATRWGWLVTM